MNQNQAGQAAETLGSFAAKPRSKKWDECDMEEKVERLRRELLNARDTAMAGYRNAAQAQELAQRHQHNQTTGEVLRSAERLGGGMVSEGRGQDPLL